MPRGKLSPEERARRYAAKLEALCAKPQWRKRDTRVLKAEFHAIHGQPPSTPSQRWYLDEDGPLANWGAQPTDGDS